MGLSEAPIAATALDAAPSTEADYVPALGFHWQSAVYDPLVQRWGAATRMRCAVVEALALKPGMRVLELGAGPGRLAIQLRLGHPETEVDTLDIDPSMVARAQHNSRRAKAGVRCFAADITRLEALPVRGGYDRIVSTMVFHHLNPTDKLRALRVARALLAPGGRFVLADFSPPKGSLQWALFTLVQQPLDGFVNTSPHRTGHFREAVLAEFPGTESRATWRTAAGTIELLCCRP